MSPSVVVVNPQLKHIITIQVPVAVLKFRNFIMIDFFFSGTSWIQPWTTQNTF